MALLVESELYGIHGVPCHQSLVSIVSIIPIHTFELGFGCLALIIAPLSVLGCKESVRCKLRKLMFALKDDLPTKLSRSFL